MKDTNWHKVQQVFDTAVGLGGRKRSAYLKSVETNNREIHSEVVSLLSADGLGDILPHSQANFDFLTNENLIAADTDNFDVFATNQEISLVGEIIGNRYHITKRLGSGGMGDVFLANDRNVMNRETVVKLLKSETLGNKEFVRKFKQEIEALARLKDPGIVTILDSGTYGKQPFLVLEYVEGEDLALIISPILFSVRDFINPSRFLVQLTNKETKLSGYFWERFSPDARSFFSENHSEKERLIALRDEFNRLLSDQYLYAPDVFSESEISAPPSLEDLWENSGSLATVNRSLIEAAFPQEIVSGKNKKLTSGEAAHIFRQLGASLTHGHHKGIIHRDLKPANIMITQNERGEWQTKLIDFGVAKVRESLVAPTTEVGLSFGTRKYMSPEQINGKANLTAQTDIYALGLIAFEALTGQHIFRTDSFIEQCRMQEQEEFSEITEIRPDLSSRVREIICRALSFEPENRQASAAEFGNELADALATPLPVLPQTKPFIPIKQTDVQTDILDNRDNFVIKDLDGKGPENGSKKGLVAAGILAILLLAGAGGWLIWHNASKTDTSSQTNVSSAPPSAVVKRELNYQLTVQKYYQGKPFQPPFEATGDEIFGDDWRFRMMMNSPQKGNLYLLSENQKTQKLKMLFPHPQKNDGKSDVQANEKIETGEMAFDKNQGAEKFWIVWADKPVTELEAVKSYVNPQDLGSIKDAEKETAVRTFLDKTTADEQLTEKTANDKQSKKLMTTSDILVKMAEFRHN